MFMKIPSNNWQSITRRRIIPILKLSTQINKIFKFNLRLHNNHIFDNTSDRKNNIKFYLIEFWLIFNLVRYTIYLVFSKYNALPIYLFDVIHYLKALALFKYLTIIMLLSL